MGLEPGALSPSPFPDGFFLSTCENTFLFEGKFSTGKKFSLVSSEQIYLGEV